MDSATETRVVCVFIFELLTVVTRKIPPDVQGAGDEMGWVSGHTESRSSPSQERVLRG